MYKFRINAFDGEGGSGTAGASGAGSSGANTQAAAGIEANGNSQQTDAASDTSMSFDEYRKAHKDEVTKWFNKEFGARHRDYADLKARADASAQIIDMVATKFGIEDRNDIASITHALENDDYLYAERAEENNRTIEEQREWDKRDRELRRLHEEAKAKERDELRQRQMLEWERQSNNLKAIFPNFDIDAELSNPEFVQMLTSGISMDRAFYAIHGEEITSGAMQYTANAVRQATAEDLATRRSRPRENGLSSQASAKTSKDLHNLSKKERAALAAKSMAGPIRF